MADCKTCGAPLPPNDETCKFCGTRNDVDLHGIHEFTVKIPHSERICPNCHRALQTIDLNVDDNFYIERCEHCLSLFFDPGELQGILTKSVSNVFEIDHRLIERINNARYRQKSKVRYVKCPVCQKLMNRINFAARSGVVVDRCLSHGIWLDAGELRHLLEWRKAGGQMHHEHVDKLRRKKKQNQRTHTNNSYRIRSSTGHKKQSQLADNGDLIDTIGDIIASFFR